MSLALLVHDMDAPQALTGRAAGVRLIGQARHLQQLRSLPVRAGYGVLQGFPYLLA